MQAGLQTLRVTFDDSASPATATWEDKSPPTSVTTLDPILYTDPVTGRTQSRSSSSRAASWPTATTTARPGRRARARGIAVGRRPPDGGRRPLRGRDARPDPAVSARRLLLLAGHRRRASARVSLDGGRTFGPAVPIYNLTQCGGLHGHVKVAPDGTAYVPNKSCGGGQGVAVSTDNGLTWTVRTVPGSAAGASDPSVGIGADGTVYFGYSERRRPRARRGLARPRPDLAERPGRRRDLRHPEHRLPGGGGGRRRPRRLRLPRHAHRRRLQDRRRSPASGISTWRTPMTAARPG